MHWPGFGVADYQCCSSRRRENANNALMSPNKQTNLPCLARAAAVAFVALHVVALHTPAQAQVQAETKAPAHFVAPDLASQVVPTAALATTPTAVPAIAAVGARPVVANDSPKPVAA